MRELLVERAQQYEDHFLHHPLTSATHDDDIAHQLVQYTLNHEGSCVVRYFRFGTSDAPLNGEEASAPDSLGIMVCRNGLLTLLPPIPYAEVTASRDRSPRTSSTRIPWRRGRRPAVASGASSSDRSGRAPTAVAR
ncbi:hypothetical protein L1856_08725 [Streptomyces sp. Tue 6430]|nr:hypothetical protein [Streptomyces sp. Tue 6430]